MSKTAASKTTGVLTVPPAPGEAYVCGKKAALTQEGFNNAMRDYFEALPKSGGNFDDKMIAMILNV